MDVNPFQAPWIRVAGLAVAGALLMGGCGGGTGPDGNDPVAFTFMPSTMVRDLVVGQTLTCVVRAEPAVAIDVTWRLRGVVVGTTADYTYDAASVRRDTLRAHAESGQSTGDWFWVIDVAANEAAAPPNVTNVRVMPGFDPAQVLMTWNRVPGSTWPITHYVVKVGYDGPVTAWNWDSLPTLAEAPHQAGLGTYIWTFSEADGLTPGAEAWFAVRARDDHGQLSPRATCVSTVITSEWWIDGQVTDDLGLPLPDVMVGTAEPPRSGATDGAGHYRLGPFRSIDAVRVQAVTSDYCSFTSAPVAGRIDTSFDILLPNRYAVAPDCQAYGGSFLDYLRDMTRTATAYGDTTTRRLWRWDTYPVKVFLPDSTLGTGRQLDDLARPMLALWNEKAGETLLVEVESAAEADAHFRWVTDAFAGYGQVSLDVPAGGVIGSVRPERMRVEIETGLQTDQFFQEVVLHELGHVLGLYEHYDMSCPSSGHLMIVGAAGNLSLPEPIHADEIRAVKMVRRLKQGVWLGGYER